MVGFKKLSAYDDLLIKPSNEVPVDLLLDHYNEMKHGLAARYLNETEQLIVVLKICCPERQAKLKKELWAYNDILFIIHLLKYIDNVEYKKYIRKALNRGEGYNRIFNSVVNVGNKKIRGLREEKTKIWNHCTRLLTLIIIYYNSYILLQVIADKHAKNDEKGAKLLVKFLPWPQRWDTQ